MAKSFLKAVQIARKRLIVTLPPTLYVAIPNGLALPLNSVPKGKQSLSRGILSSHLSSDSSFCALAYHSSIGSPCSKKVHLLTLIGIYIHTPTLVMHIQCAGSKFLEAICARKSNTRIQQLKGLFWYLRAFINITCFGAKRKADEAFPRQKFTHPAAKCAEAICSYVISILPFITVDDDLTAPN